MNKRPKIIAILLAYNASETLGKFYKEFPKKFVDDIILIDDASKDNTFELAKKLGIHSYKNPINLGYGGNMKKALAVAIKCGADVIIDIHPDGEYKPLAIPEALRKIQEGNQFVLGNRFTNLTKPIKSGMYIWKLIPLRLLNSLDSLILGVRLNDFHQGFRIYTRDMLEQINFEVNSNDYLFSFEIIAQSIFEKIKISQVPVETNYTGKKRGASLKHSIKYSLGTFKILLLFLLAKMGFKTILFYKPSEALKKRVDRLLSNI